MQDLKLYESHFDKSILVAAVYDPKEEENLGFKTIISLFRIGKLYIGHRRLKECFSARVLY
jgi:hypothetical protein